MCASDEMEFTNIMKTSKALKALRLTLLAGVWLWCLHGVVRADVNDAPAAALPATPLAEAGAEHFVPHVSRIDCDGTIQMIRSAEIGDNTIRVRDVARWSDADSVGFSSIADLVIDHFDDSTNRRISMDELRSTLKGAGVNLAQVDFAGAGSCLVTRNESLPIRKQPTNDHEVVAQWIEDSSKAYRGHATEASEKPPAPPTDEPPANDPPAVKVRALRDLLIEDLSQRLNLSVDDLQLTFDPKDRAYLGLTEPLFQFQLEPRRINDLGKISWDVTISSGKNDQKVTINANARAWERQLVVTNSLSYRQVLKDDDLTERRVLVDHVETDPLLTRKQIVGQQASRDLKAGMVLTSRMLDPIPLVKQGDFVSVTLKSGGVSIHTVATAMEPGSYGQSIRVKDASNQNVFVVTMTGPQEAVMGPAAAKPEVASTDK
jgi:flagella basal body P-ring formation protein FlgA